ncbi:hypothetical protein BDW69DRAFT_190920 [Aspergillus filifer]
MGLYYTARMGEIRIILILDNQGWEKPTGDCHFAKQRRNADNTAYSGALRMRNFTPDQLSILDMCMAPGGYLAEALRVNSQANAVAFTLLPADRGHDVLLSETSNITMRFLDVTTLVADVGHFDLALCDGQRREATILALTQLIISVSHLKQSGTMVILLHKLEAPDTVLLLHAFDKFATVRLFKPAHNHATLSSFYMIATNVMSQSVAAKTAIGQWRNAWKIATFELDIENSAYDALVYKNSPDVGSVVEEFGPRLIEMGRRIWGGKSDPGHGQRNRKERP